MPILFWLQLLSRYPEKTISGRKYYSLTQIFALRLKLVAILMPQKIRVRNNKNILHEINANDVPINISKGNEAYYNLWLNLSGCCPSGDKLQIECQYFGIFIPVMTIRFIINENISKLAKSDSYIDPKKLSSKSIRGELLEAEILNFSSVVYSAASKDLSKKINTILLLRLDQLGDFVLSLPAVKELKVKNPGVEITLLVSAANETLARSTGLFDYIYVIPFSFKEQTNERHLSEEAIQSVATSVGNNYYDVAVDLSPMPETRELLSYINSDHKFGIQNTDTSMLDFGLLIHPKDPINQLSMVNHQIYPLLLIDAVNRFFRQDSFHLPKIQGNFFTLTKFDLTNINYIVIHSGARNLLVRWQKEYFINLAIELLKMNKFVVFFSDESLLDEHRSILSIYSTIRIIDHRLPFEDFDTIISNAKLFIGNDSGPKHLSALRNVATISIHSPRTNWREWGQVDSGYIVTTNVPCAGCGVVTAQECAKDLVCIKKIQVSDLMSLIEKQSV